MAKQPAENQPDEDLVGRALRDGRLSAEDVWELIGEYWEGRRLQDLDRLIGSQIQELAHIAAMVLSELGSKVYSALDHDQRNYALHLIDILLDSSHGCTVNDAFDAMLCCPSERDAHFTGKFIERAIEGTVPIGALTRSFQQLAGERRKEIVGLLSVSHRDFLVEIGLGD